MSLETLQQDFLHRIPFLSSNQQCQKKALKAQNKETSSVHPSSSPKTAARLTVAPMPRPYYFGPNGIV